MSDEESVWGPGLRIRLHSFGVQPSCLMDSVIPVRSPGPPWASVSSSVKWDEHHSFLMGGGENSMREYSERTWLSAQHFLKECSVAHSCPILGELMDYSPPGSSVHEILQNTEAGCHFLLQGIFPTQGSNSHLRCLLYWGVDSLPLALPQAPSYVHNSAQITRTRDFTVETKPTLFML